MNHKIFKLVLLISYIGINGLSAQDKVGINTLSPEQALDINGKIRIGDDSSLPTEGTIKFINGTFMGYDGSTWHSLTNKPKRVLGPSATSTNGNISYGGLEGIFAADSMCRASFPSVPTAHMYTLDEIFEAYRLQNIDISMLSTGVLYWIWSTATSATTKQVVVSGNVHFLSYAAQSSRYSTCECYTKSNYSPDWNYGRVVRFYNTASNLLIFEDQISDCQFSRKILCGE